MRKVDASKLLVLGTKPDMKKIVTKTGGVAPASGQYRANGTGLEITLTKGERVPPHTGKARNFTLVDPTKHK